MKDNPLVSVLMTVYNREKYIAEAIESVINSIYQNWELIIVDDQSKDNSVEIAKKYELQDSRIRVYVNEKNLGDYPNRNKAASYAKGEYIKYLDSDDIIYPHGLEVMVKSMEQYPNSGIGLSFNSYSDKVRLPINMKPTASILYHFSYKGLLYIGPSGCIFKKSFFEAIGAFNPKYKVAADYEFNLRAANHSKIVLFQRDLIWWRQHDSQEIIESNKNDEYIILNYKIQEKELVNSQLNKAEKKQLITNNKILMGRRLLKLLLKLNFYRTKRIIKETQFPLNYFFRCFLPTRKLNTPNFNL